MTQSQSASKEPRGIIIAGTGSHEKTFYAPQSALEKSTVIKSWIEDKDSIPQSVLKGDALHFPDCDPEAVSATIEYLNSTKDSLISILDPSYEKSKDALFYIKIYKFAACLGLSELCAECLNKIKKITWTTEVFLDVLSICTEEKASLVDDPQFRDLLMDYMEKKSEVLKISTLFKSTILQNNELAWRLCSLLISSLGGTSNRTAVHYIPTSTPSTPHTPASNVSSVEPTPEMERRKSPYSYQPQPKSPSSRTNINRIKKPQKDGTRKFSATVEDAIDREYLSPNRGLDK